MREVKVFEEEIKTAEGAKGVPYHRLWENLRRIMSKNFSLLKISEETE